MPRNETSGFGPHDVTMPQLGMAQDAGRIVSWLKAPGDKVAKGDALFEVETDKATMEVEAQASGYLTHVRAQAGEDVPVGQAIARISESADAAEDDAAPAPAAESDTASDAEDTLPEGREITMPQLGMAQDSGVMVGWLVEPGAQVGADDLLFEVETDKATMEVPAGAEGYLAATLAQKGDDVPVGQVVAIIAAEKPANPVSRALTQAAPAAPSPAPQAAPEPPAAHPADTPAASSVALPASGRILASPKLKRVAQEKGLDLGRLVAAGHPQPYHMRDLEVLENLPADAPAPQPGTTPQAMRLEAVVAQDGFAPFAASVAGTLDDADALLAGLAGASLGAPCIVAIEHVGVPRAFAVPAGRRLSGVTESEDAPDLLLRDLRASALCGVALGAEDVPVLSVLSKGDGLALVLECDPQHMAPAQAIALLSEFAGRMGDPLRHLL
ncbi:MAG: pyruvate dehydrogenase [Rhodobacteraceae bacterium]|nr:pyruvate dehydrogenase [Paracoccaceae bacterium]